MTKKDVADSAVQHTAKTLGERLIKRVVTFGRPARFAFLMWKLRARAQFTRALSYMSQGFGFIRRLLIIVFSIVVGWVAVHFGASSATSQSLSGYLVTTAAMIGGTTAIIFSIMLFLLQGSSDLYASRHFDGYAAGLRGGQTIYGAIIAIAVCLFGLALYLAGQTSMEPNVASGVIIGSLAAVGLIFALIDLQYEGVTRKVKPAEGIAFLRRSAAGSIDRMRRAANDLAEILRFREPKLSAPEAEGAAYVRFLNPAIVDLGKQIEMLIDVAARLAERQDTESARTALSSAADLIVQYLNIRKNSSLSAPSSVLLVSESDSHSFLVGLFLRLNRAAERFARQGQGDLAGYIADLYATIARVAKDMKFTGTGENPILEQTMAFANAYATSGFPSPNLEMLYQGARVLGEIGAMAAATGQAVVLHGTQECIAKIATVGMGLGATVVPNQCTSAYLTLIAATFGSDVIDRRMSVEASLQGVGDIALLLEKAGAAGIIPNQFDAGSSTTKGYFEFIVLLEPIVSRYYGIGEGAQKRRYRRDLVMLFDELRSNFRSIAKHVQPDSLLSSTIGRLAGRIQEVIIALMQRDDFADVRDHLHEVVRWLCYAPYWFVHESEQFALGSPALSNLGDEVAQVGIAAWKYLQDGPILEESIKAIDAIASGALQKGTGGSGYAEPRIFQRACYLGILALKSGWRHILDDLRVRIQKFEVRYIDKYLSAEQMPDGVNPYSHNISGLPHADQLRREVERWLTEFEYEQLNGAHLSADAEDMMYDLVNRSDIEAFVQEIWS